MSRSLAVSTGYTVVFMSDQVRTSPLYPCAARVAGYECARRGSDDWPPDVIVSSSLMTTIRRNRRVLLGFDRRQIDWQPGEDRNEREVPRMGITLDRGP
jgi:hypothetical protein